MTKICKKCQEEKPLECFGRPNGRTTTDGYDIYCKECRNAYARAYRVRTNGVYHKDYYQKNKEQHSQRMSEWRSMNSERFKAMIANWVERNPERSRELQSIHRGKRRARLHDVPYDNVGIVTLYARDNGVCGLCYEHVNTEDASVDHVIPISKGGDGTWSNVQLAHLSCNMHKGNRI